MELKSKIPSGSMGVKMLGCNLQNWAMELQQVTDICMMELSNSIAKNLEGNYLNFHSGPSLTS